MFHHFGCVSWIHPGQLSWNFLYEHTTEFVPVTEPVRLPGSYEEALSRELRQYGGNPVVQGRRFGISKRYRLTPFTLFSFLDVWSLACLNSKDFPLFVSSQAIIHAMISSLWRVSQTPFFYWSWLCSSLLPNFTLYNLVLAWPRVHDEGFFGDKAAIAAIEINYLQ